VQPDVEPYSAKSGEYDIVELLENKIIEAEIRGSDITNVNLRIRRLVPYAVNVRIPVGSFFVSENPSAQNMVATGANNVRLTTAGWQSISIPAACANRPKDIPDSSDKFSVQRLPNQEELARLMPVLNKSGAGTTTKQAAVWMITDNADYDDLGILVSSPGNVRAIGPETTARAMKICVEAGIDITKKNIWRDRETIISKLPAGELKNWLKNFDKPEQTPPAPSTIKTKTLDAKMFLNKLPNAVPVTDAENKIGLSIKSITKSDGDYIVDYYCTNELVSNRSYNQSSDNLKILTTQIYFIDPENYDNHYQPFTIVDGEMKMTFKAGDRIGFPLRRISFEPPSKVMYMYFVGVEKGGDNPPELYTVPLFFTLVLGDNPQVFEEIPRHAGNIFDKAIKNKSK
jgi:hypothetical protein